MFENDEESCSKVKSVLVKLENNVMGDLFVLKVCIGDHQSQQKRAIYKFKYDQNSSWKELFIHSVKLCEEFTQSSTFNLLSW